MYTYTLYARWPDGKTTREPHLSAQAAMTRARDMKHSCWNSPVEVRVEEERLNITHQAKTLHQNTLVTRTTQRTTVIDF